MKATMLTFAVVLCIFLLATAVLASDVDLPGGPYTSSEQPTIGPVPMPVATASEEARDQEETEMHAATVQTYAVPDGAPKNEMLTVQVNGIPCGVFANQQHAFAQFSFGNGPVTVEIACRFDVESVKIRPQAAGIEAKQAGRTVSFELDRPRKLSVEINGNRYLFLFADALERNLPDRKDPAVIWYGPGYYDLGGRDIVLKSDQSLYVSGGAYLANVGGLRVENAKHVRVRGRGVLASCTRIDGSRDVEVEGIVIAPIWRGWMNVIHASQDVTYHNVKVLTGDDSVYNYDGFDVMSGCYHITIDDVFIRATDDLLSIKHYPTSQGYWGSKAPISYVTLSNAVLWVLTGGSVVRVGPETIGPSIERVSVHDVDVIHHDVSSAFEMQTIDGVQVRDMSFERIRIENAHLPVLDFNMGGWMKVGPYPGQVRGVYFRDIDVQGPAPMGSIRDGDAEHGYRDIYFDNVRWNGREMPAGPQEVAGHPALVNTGARLAEDTTPPTVTDAVAYITDAERRTAQVYVMFSEPIDRDTAEVVAHYTIGRGVRVLEARRDDRFQQVILSTTGMRPGAAYTLKVSGIRDLVGNLIARGTAHRITLKPAWKASEGDGSYQGRLGWWYEYFEPTAEPAQRDHSLGRWTPLRQYVMMGRYHTAKGEQWLGLDADVSIRDGSMQAGQRYWAVHTWRAPVAGTVQITGTVRQTTPGAGTFGARICKNPLGTNLPQDDTVLWQEHPADGRGVQHTVTTQLPAGGVIRFAVTDGPGQVEWDPAITYLQP